MSDGGERTCPLCAEEMDLTDQQLKPCKCGYEICVWCWHHIMDMAEKDDTEGRCPACRAPYNKEKIVGMAANCERLVAEISMERKKNQKSKSKPSDGRKQLSSVRVIQRNLVYIVGLPLDLADEDLLQRREYFGQYGKVLKVSMSRTAAGVIQQFPNNTCSVYITYSKEDEAIRCIQNVHGFVLEGRPLRACFGTTKYCHAWLRNVPCSNPDCLYLHEIGSQEDSFTKDEIISAYTRSRVQQITGTANNMERRSGNILPAPLDDYVNNSSGKPIVKNVSSNSASILRGSPPNGSPGKTMALPPAAAWATRATSCQPPAAGLLCPNGPSKPKADTVNSALGFSSAVAGSTQASPLHSNATKRPPSSDGSHNILPRVKNELSKPFKHYNSMDNLTNAGEKPAISDGFPTAVDLEGELSSLQLSKDSDRCSCTTTNATNSTDVTGQSCSPGPEEAIIATNEEVQNLCSDRASVGIDRKVGNEQHGITRPNSPPSDYYLLKSPQLQGSQQHNADAFRDAQIATSAGKVTSDSGAYFSREPCALRLDAQAQVVSATAEVEDDITSFDEQRLKDPEVVCHCPYLPNSSSFLHVSNNSNSRLMQQGQPCTALNADSLPASDKFGVDSLRKGSRILSNGYTKKLVASGSSGLNGFEEHSFSLQDERNEQCVGRLVSEKVNTGSGAAMDRGESNIISNILSMDLWDDSLTSPQNLAKLLGDTDSQSGTLKKSSSWRVQSNNQSRFSFARHDESKFQTFDVHPSYSFSEQLPKSRSFVQDFAERDFHMDKLGTVNGFHTSNLEETENLGSCHFVSSNKLSAVSRAQISAPPGFSVPSRPPPGFSSHERAEQAFDAIPGNSLLEPSPLLRNPHQTPSPSTGNLGTSGDIEFMDPAILAVGKGRLPGALNSPGLDMRSNYLPQVNYLENEARLQLLMQRSQQQNLRFSEIGNTFSQTGDSYGISSRLDQPQVSNLAPFAQLSLQQSRNPILSNGQWDGWNEVQSGNNLGVAEILRNGRHGFNKFYTGYDDSKYRMPNSGDLYSRTFGM